MTRVPAVRGALACLYGSHGPDPRSTKIVLGLLAAPGEAARLVGLETDRRLGGAIPASRVTRLVDDPSGPIRAAALATLAARQDMDRAQVDVELVRALDDDVAEVRATAAQALSDRESTPTGLARRAVQRLEPGAGGGADRAPRSRPGCPTGGHRLDARPARTRHGAPSGARRRWLPRNRAARPRNRRSPSCWRSSSRREARTIGLALRALVVLGVPEAGGVIRRCLHSDDAEIRAQAIEALDSIGDRELPQALVRLLEDEAIDVRDRDAALARLADDDDPWISGLARRVRAGADAMPDTSRTLGDLETMMLLRRVPLFDGLEPEDLQRIAMTSVEHVYPVDEALVREGDVGDELIVIVEGSVRVVRAQPDGTERLIRRYEAGDHIGELAVLREAPRAATVIAEGDGVRGLVIGGAGLKSILRERPDAAMAMLADARRADQPPVTAASSTDGGSAVRPLPTGTVTFLRTDVEGSMALARPSAPTGTRSMSPTSARCARRSIGMAGSTVRTEGDALFAAFPEAGAAVLAAIDGQRALHGQRLAGRRRGPRPDGPPHRRSAPRRRRLRRLRGQSGGPDRGGGSWRADRGLGDHAGAWSSRACRRASSCGTSAGMPSGTSRTRAAVPARRPGPAARLPAAAPASEHRIGNLPDRLTTFVGRASRAGRARGACSTPIASSRSPAPAGSARRASRSNSRDRARRACPTGRGSWPSTT